MEKAASKPKKESIKDQKEKAKAEKEAALAGMTPAEGGKISSILMQALEESVETIKTPKSKGKTKQKGEMIHDTPEVVQNDPPAPKGGRLDKENENSMTQALKDVEEYAAEMVQKSRYKDKDPKKIALAIFRVLPECDSITNQQFAKHFGIGRNTVTRWELDKTFIKARNEFSELYFKRFTPKILNHLIKGAQKTSWVNGLVDTAAIKLFLQYVEKWNEKQEVDVTSDGKAITWGIAPSQFIKSDKIPKVLDPEDDEDD